MGENHIGEILKEQRKNLGLTLRELENITNISYSQLSKYERGQSTPTKSNIEKLSSALNIEKDTLMMLAGFVDEDVKEQVSRAIVTHSTGSGKTGMMLGLGATLGFIAGGPVGGVIGSAIGTAFGAALRERFGVAETKQSYDTLKAKINDTRFDPPKWVAQIEKAVESDEDFASDDERWQLIIELVTHYKAKKSSIISSRENGKA